MSEWLIKKKTYKKLLKTYIKYDFIQKNLSELLLFFIWVNEQFAHKKLSDLLFYHEQPERIAHCHSFVMSNLSDSLMVALLSWVTWAICSQSLIFPEQSERFTHSCSFVLSDLSKWAMSKWAKSQPCKNSAMPYVLACCKQKDIKNLACYTV